MAQTESVADKKLPPYLPYRTFANFIEGLRVGIPARIDRSVMQSLSGANQSWLLGALRYLNLINDSNAPTDGLRRLVEAEGADRKARLQEIARSAYPALFREGFHLQTATPKQLDEVFGSMGPQGDTVRRCVTFFVALAKDAELAVSPHIRKSTRATRAIRKRRTGNGGAVSLPGEPEEQPQAPRPSSWTDQLLAKFPTFDPAWPDDVKTKWFEGFERLMKLNTEQKEKAASD